MSALSRTTAWLGAMTFAWLASPSPARACSCMSPGSPVAAAAGARAVFEGRSFSVRHQDGKAIYHFEVSRVWKGDVGEDVDVQTALSSAMCGRTFETGTSYIVYAHAGAEGLADNLCSRSRPASAASEDFAVLGPGSPPVGARPDTTAAPAVEPPRIEPTPPPVAHGSRGCAISGVGGHVVGDLGDPESPWWLTVLPLLLRRRRAKDPR